MFHSLSLMNEKLWFTTTNNNKKRTTLPTEKKNKSKIIFSYFKVFSLLDN